jgi:hypothetical protein
LPIARVHTSSVARAASDSRIPRCPEISSAVIFVEAWAATTAPVFLEYRPGQMSNRILIALLTVSTLLGGGVATRFLLVHPSLAAASAVASHNQPIVAAKATAWNRRLVAQSVLTRTLAIEDPMTISRQADSMPEGLLARDPSTRLQRGTLWSFFFKGTLTKLVLANSPEPLILYYNPILDAAVVEGCHQTGQSFVCDELCAFPGEAIEGVKPSRMPSWYAAPSPLEALRRLAAQRLTSMAAVQSGTVATWKQRLCSRDHQSAAETRLLDSFINVTHLDLRGLANAITVYLVDQARADRAAAQVTSRRDPAARILANLETLSISGALPLGKNAWVVFLTPKRTGWLQSAVLFKETAAGRMKVQSAAVFDIDTHGTGGESL